MDHLNSTLDKTKNWITKDETIQNKAQEKNKKIENKRQLYSEKVFCAFRVQNEEKGRGNIGRDNE